MKCVGAGLLMGALAALAAVGCGERDDVMRSFPSEHAVVPTMPVGIRAEITQLADELARFRAPDDQFKYPQRVWPKAKSFATSLRDNEMLILAEDSRPVVRAMAIDAIFDRRPWLAKSLRIREADEGVVGSRSYEAMGSSCFGPPRMRTYREDFLVRDLFYERLCEGVAPEVKGLRDAMAETNPRALCRVSLDRG